MKNVLVILALISTVAACETVNAHAAASKLDNLPAPSYRTFYLVNGKETAADQAIIAALKGSEAFKCSAVEAKLSKSGTSIGIHNVKKPKIATSN